MSIFPALYAGVGIVLALVALALVNPRITEDRNEVDDEASNSHDTRER